MIDEQVKRLRTLGVRKRIEPPPLPRARASGAIPLVLVAPIEIEKVLPRLETESGRAFVELRPKTVADFAPIIEVPRGEPYLLLDVDTGADYLDVKPERALKKILALGRSPLTLEEGVAVLLQFPEVLEEENAFSLLGSRCGDQRVPALWTSRLKGKRGPRLGWCWNRNPHSWLGAASCARRVTSSSSRRPKPRT